jgi:hypothetical protein
MNDEDRPQTFWWTTKRKTTRPIPLFDQASPIEVESRPGTNFGLHCGSDIAVATTPISVMAHKIDSRSRTIHSNLQNESPPTWMDNCFLPFKTKLSSALLFDPQSWCASFWLRHSRSGSLLPLLSYKRLTRRRPTTKQHPLCSRSPVRSNERRQPKRLVRLCDRPTDWLHTF